MDKRRKIHGTLVAFRDLGAKIELVFDCDGQRVVERCPKAPGLVEYLESIRGNVIDFDVNPEEENDA